MDRKNRDFKENFSLSDDKKNKIDEKIKEAKRRKRSSFDLIPPKEKILNEDGSLKDINPKNVVLAKKVKEKIIEKKLKNEKNNYDEDIRKKIEKTHHELFPDVDINIEKELSTTPSSSPIGDIEIPEKDDVSSIPPLKKGKLKIKSNSYIKQKGITDRLSSVDTKKVKKIVDSVDRGIESKIIFISRFLSGLFDFFVMGIISFLFYYLASLITGADIVNKNFVFYFSLLFLTNFIFYSTVFLFTVKRTPGMMVGGVRLVSQKKLTILHILFREIIFLFSIVFFGIGLLWGVFSKNNQCWHDIIIDAYVIRDK